MAQLQAGMSREAVKQLLGTPLLQDPFHPNRWDYLFRLEHGGESGETRQHYGVAITFSDKRGGVVTHIERNGTIPLRSETVRR
ncbi:MAG: outer membrane protein assembly factor BamE [Gammaproteobacteria bacterium]|nr:outer membrane protein assembly factor BamE [Gammaproteobacteria bacterium]